MNRDFAVIFDMNGTIIDDMPYHIEAWQEFAKRRNKIISSEEFDKMLAGRTNLETIRYIVGEDTSEETAAALSEEKEIIYRQVYTPHLALLAGLRELLDELRINNIPMAVGTAAPVENVNLVMDGLNIRHYFKAIVDDTQVEHGKPFPDLFLHAAHILEKKPENCLVFEDSFLGMEAAKRASMKAIGIATTHHFLPHALKMIKDFTEINLNEIEEICEMA